MSNRTFYVDCNGGSDTNDGLSENAPWKGFAPVQELTLGPGDRVEVIRPGDFETSLIINGEGSEENPIEVMFAPGDYHLYGSESQARCYNISNNNEEPDVPKRVGILVENAKNVVIKGCGAKLVCRRKMIAICLDHSENVEVRDLKVDYHRPTVSEFKVISADDSSAELEVHPDSTYSVADGKITWVGEGWEYDTGLAQELIPETGKIWRRKDPLLDLRIEESGSGRIKAFGEHTMISGRVFQLRNTYRDCVGIFVRRSRSVTFENLDLYYLHGMGIVGQFSEDITLNRVRMAPEEGSGRTCSVWADSTHFSGCRGQIVYRDCIFDGAHDDAINVHGTYLQVQEVISERTLRLKFMHRQTYGFNAFNPRDEVDFVRWDSMEIFGEGTVTGAELINPYEMNVTLDRPIPKSVRVKDVLENVTWTPSVEVTGCTIKRIPTRGFLLTTRKKVVVDNNHFIRMHRNGINIEADTSNWFESGCVRDMTISNNTFEECGVEAILITPRQSVPNTSVHQNIRITRNTFILPEAGIAVKAAGTDKLEISGNVIELTTGTHDRDLMVTNDCDSVIIKKNTFKRSEQEM